MYGADVKTLAFPSGLKLFRFQRKTMPWKSDLKASPQKVILRDGRQPNNSIEKPLSFPNKSKKT